MNICYCGSQAGYPHAPDCPYPLYHTSEKKELEWLAAREELRRQMESPSRPEQNGEVDKLLVDFGITEPTLSELLSLPLQAPAVEGWIRYAREHKLKPGFVIQRLRAGDKPPRPTNKYTNHPAIRH